MPCSTESAHEHCPRCFHVIGEHYLCADHGGEIESVKVDKSVPKPRYPCPDEALWDCQHPYFDFVDTVDGKDK